MSETRRFPFGGVPVYNPLSLSKGEALAQFQARQAAYQSLMDLLREERPSHVLIIGTRGMGKTTLLQRVQYGVEEDAALDSRYLVLAFPEEQYNVNRLYRFLLNTVDALADAMERLGKKRTLARVEAYAGNAGKLSHEEIEEGVPRFLAEIGREIGRSFLLLVDNADRLFDKIEEQEQWRLRELLSSRPDLTFFGATTQASEGIYGADRAFFEFFKIHSLTPLTFEEVRVLLLHLSESVEEREGEKGSAKRRVKAWLDADAARLRTLVQLTGGNPRTTVLLFHLVLDELDGGAREYLEQLLDQCTPTYKGRVDELPAQAQQVLDAVALKWDPATAMEVAADTGLETSAVSTQLTRLVRQGLLEKADPGDSKKALYQVAERFFNIWYLMRASRRVRAKLRWFVEFLRVFFEQGELEQMTWKHLECFRSARKTRPAEIESAFAYALASGADRKKFEDYLRRECAAMEPEWRPYLDSIPCSVDDAHDGKGIGNGSAEMRRGLIEVLEELRRSLSAIKAIVIELDNVEDLGDLGCVPAELRDLFGKAEESLRSVIEIDPKMAWCWNFLGNLIGMTSERMEEAEADLRKAIELDPTSAGYWADLGNLFGRTPERSDEAEAAYRKAIEFDPTSAGYWADLGQLLGRMPERSDEAEAALRKATELDPKSAGAWNNLGNLLGRTPERSDEAEAALRKAIEPDPKSAGAWNNPGNLLGRTPERSDEAEAAYRKAIELDPKRAWSWANLGNLLGKTPERRHEGAAALRKAVELDPKSAGFWNNLGGLLSEIPERREEAETAFNEALEIEPRSGFLWSCFGFFLACRAGKPREAEVVLRKAVELEPDSSRDLRNLGVLLYCEMVQEDEAVQHLRRAYQLKPADPVSAAILAACYRGSDSGHELLPILMDASRGARFWDDLLGLCQNYAPFGKILLGICDLVQERDSSNGLARLHRAVALAQVGDFPRASVALDDALAGDPIELLSFGRWALDVFFAAAVRRGRIRDCLELLDKKEWKDAWRPIYEALRAVEEGSSEYLKRVAVEIRDPAMKILRRIAPELSGLASRTN
ncbi:MAG: tetratricopeptide repeat protein [Bryobacterales bacterium]|nr:tetratricopeptide repeat protein [Bryobacterales bacterium]